jgi:hypothetical protein
MSKLRVAKIKPILEFSMNLEDRMLKIKVREYFGG